MRCVVLALLGALVMSLVSCGMPVQKSPQGESASSGAFSLVFKYGVGAKNVLDTGKGTFTKDMITAPSRTVKLTLTQEELDRISAKMDEIDFWNYPLVLEPETPAYVVTPYASYYFTVKSALGVKELRWDDRYGDEGVAATRLRELTVLIREIIESKPEYKALPEPRGGYM